MAFDQKEYYRRNKMRISEARKRRYREDPNYRRKIQRKSRAYKRSKSLGRPKGIIKSTKGTFFTIGRLSSIIKRKVKTIRAYHRNGVLPNPTHFDTRGWRLYTRHQVRLLVCAFESLDRGELDGLKDIRALVESEWEE